MGTLIFDIETVGEKWADLDTTSQEVLSHWIEKTAKTEEDREAELRDLQNGLGFSPLTGYIVAIGLFDLEREKGVVFYDNKGESHEEIEHEGYVLKPRSEAAMLADFWEGARRYTTFVTFNGRMFDAPFLALRSAIHGITPSRDLLEGRYLYQQRSCKHIDLADQLSFYGAMYRKASLHMYCRAFGITSPKALGVTGDDVAELFEGGCYTDIARYNVRDVIATTKLYEKWRRYLAFQK